VIGDVREHVRILADRRAACNRDERAKKMRHDHIHGRQRAATASRTAIAAAAFALLAACTLAPVPERITVPTPVSTETATATFDTVWTVIRDTHYDPDLRGVDWEAARDTLRPRAESAGSREELRTVLHSLLGRLGESHFAVLPEELVETPQAKAAGHGSAGLRVAMCGDSLIVVEIDPGGAAERGGIRPGDELIGIDGNGLERAREALAKLADSPIRHLAANEMVTYSLLRDTVGAAREVTVRDPSGARRAVELELMEPRGEPMTMGGALHTHGWLERRSIDREGAEVGYIRFNKWLNALMPDFDRAVDDFRTAEGLILDLRGNIGGDIGMGSPLSGHFFSTHEALGTMRFRNGELRIAASPRRLDTAGRRVDPVDVPIAILVDGGSASMSEVLAGGMQATGRARVFGSRTPGMVLPSLFKTLPSGDVLQHAHADFHVSDGARLEGVGVQPDESIVPTRADLARDRDPVLDAAVAWILSQLETQPEARP